MKHIFAISAYGESPYIEECIRSLFAQEEKSEVILCTSTPSPYLEKITAKYGIPCYVREGESSLNDDWNYCIRCAASLGADLVTVAHQDDLYRSSYAKEVIHAVKKYENRVPVLLVFTGAGNIKATGEPVSGTAEKVKKVLRVFLKLSLFNRSVFFKLLSLSFGNPVPCPTCTYHLRMTGEPVFHSQSRFVIDWETLLELSGKKGRIVCVEKPLVDIRIHSGAESAREAGNGGRRKEEEKVLRKLHTAPVAALIMHFYRHAQDVYLRDSR